VNYAALLFWSGLGLAVACCDAGGSADACGPGLEMCGQSCVTQGACSANFGGSNSGVGGATTKPVDTSTLTSPDCADSATASDVLADRYSGATITTATGKQYYLASNWWSKYDGQTISYEGLTFTIGNPRGVASTSNDPIGYPTMYIGTYSGHVNAKSNLPKQVSALTTVPTVFSTNAAEGRRDEYNAAYDVWFTPDETPLGSSQYAPPAGGAYLMVWMFKPSNRQPRGQVQRDNHAVTGVDGLTWSVWVDSTNPPCISYVSTTPIDGLVFDLNDFIQDSVTNKFGITSSMYLSVVFAGFEIWAGGDGLKVKNFCAQVN
jgi:hypothetical protein